MPQKDYSQEFLKKSYVRKYCKKRIRSYAIRIVELNCRRKAYLCLRKYSWLGSFREKMWQWIFDVLTKEGRKRIELIGVREQMLISLRRAQRKLPPKIVWQEAYNYAMRGVQIADVVTFFLNVENAKETIFCPFHGGRYPSFEISQDSNTFRCSECKAHGSPVKFVMKLKDCNARAAVEMITKHI